MLDDVVRIDPLIHRSHDSRPLARALRVLAGLISRVRNRALNGMAAQWGRVRSISRDRWWLIGFAFLMFVFLIVLFLQPSAVGRGGR